ncbi:MAG: ABC transporter substrate-binding protein [Chloroflexi bacterium OHK40]
MVKILRLFAALAMLVFVLAACGGAPAAQPTSAPAAQPTAAPVAEAPTATPPVAAVSPEGRTVVRFWYGLGGQIGEVIVEQIAKFNASQDEIFVEGVFQQSYNGVQEKFQAALVSGDVPEIIQIEIHGTPKFASAGALTPLEPFYQNDPDFNFDDLVPAGLLNQRWEGQLYAMPINRSTPVLYYNKALFREAGLDPEQPPATWTEFREAARKIAQLTTPDGEPVAGFLAASSWWYFESMIWSNGGEIMNADLTDVTFAERGAEPLQLWTDMIHQDQSARFYTGDQAYTQMLEAFANGRGGMMFQSTASLGGVLRAIEAAGNKAELSTAFMPHSEGFSTAVPTGGAAAAIPAAVPDEKKAAAWEFIKWWISPEENAYWSEKTGYFPVRYSSIKILEEQGYYADRPYFYTTIEQLQFAREAPLTPFWPAISKEMQTAMEESMLNNVPAIDALRAAEERARDALE